MNIELECYKRQLQRLVIDWEQDDHPLRIAMDADLFQKALNHGQGDMDIEKSEKK